MMSFIIFLKGVKILIFSSSYLHVVNKRYFNGVITFKDIYQGLVYIKIDSYLHRWWFYDQTYIARSLERICHFTT